MTNVRQQRILEGVIHSTQEIIRSEQVIKQIIEKAIADEAFRKLLFSNPEKALAGYDLTAEEKETLSNLDEGSLDDFAGGLGDRTTKGIWPGSGAG